MTDWAEGVSGVLANAGVLDEEGVIATLAAMDNAIGNVSTGEEWVTKFNAWYEMEPGSQQIPADARDALMDMLAQIANLIAYMTAVCLMAQVVMTIVTHTIVDLGC